MTRKICLVLIVMTFVVYGECVEKKSRCRISSEIVDKIAEILNCVYNTIKEVKIVYKYMTLDYCSIPKGAPSVPQPLVFKEELLKIPRLDEVRRRYTDFTKLNKKDDYLGPRQATYPTNTGSKTAVTRNTYPLAPGPLDNGPPTTTKPAIYSPPIYNPASPTANRNKSVTNSNSADYNPYIYNSDISTASNRNIKHGNSGL